MKSVCKKNIYPELWTRQTKSYITKPNFICIYYNNKPVFSSIQHLHDNDCVFTHRKKCSVQNFLYIGSLLSSKLISYRKNWVCPLFTTERSNGSEYSQLALTWYSCMDAFTEALTPLDLILQRIIICRVKFKKVVAQGKRKMLTKVKN